MSDLQITENLHMVIDHKDFCTVVQAGMKAVFGYQLLNGLEVSQVDEISDAGSQFKVYIQPMPPVEKMAEPS